MALCAATQDSPHHAISEILERPRSLRQDIRSGENSRPYKDERNEQRQRNDIARAKAEFGEDAAVIHDAISGSDDGNSDAIGLTAAPLMALTSRSVMSMLSVKIRTSA